MLKPEPYILRQIPNLRALGDPADAPEWLTPSYIAECWDSSRLQRAWDPKVGDWYFCVDMYSVNKIESLAGFYSEGDPCMHLPSDSPAGSIASGGCDVWIPDPKTKKTLEERVITPSHSL